MTVVLENADLPAGVEPTRSQVTVQLVGANGAALGEAYNASTAKTVVGRHSLALDASGAWQLDLAPNTQLVPTGTVWGRTLSGPHIDATRSLVTVPGPVAVSAASRTSNVVTLTVPTGHGLTVGQTVTVDVTDNTFDGTFVLTVAGATTVQYAQTAADDPTGGTGTVTGHYRWDQIQADPPGSLASAALSLHQNTALAHGPLELVFTEMTATFGPVTPSNGLVVVPVVGTWTNGHTVAVPLNATRPQRIEADFILRIANVDGPAFVDAVIAPANAGEIALNAGNRFGPQLIPKVGDLPLEVAMSVVARIPENTAAASYQLFIGGSNNVGPFGTPIPVSVVVLQAGGRARMTVLVT